jgi:hypothetical protein
MAGNDGDSGGGARKTFVLGRSKARRQLWSASAWSGLAGLRRGHEKSLPHHDPDANLSEVQWLRTRSRR